MKESIAWECKHCGHRHSWKWEKSSFFSGLIFMECDKCHRETTCNLQKIGMSCWAAFWITG